MEGGGREQNSRNYPSECSFVFAARGPREYICGRL